MIRLRLKYKIVNGEMDMKVTNIQSRIISEVYVETYNQLQNFIHTHFKKPKVNCYSRRPLVVD